MTMRRRSRPLPVLALALLPWPQLLHAAPAEDDGGVAEATNRYSPEPGVQNAAARRSAAIDAALGTPPASARTDPSTSDDPGYGARRGDRTGDQTYGSTARSFNSGGELIDGLELYDQPYDDDGDYAERIPDVHVVQRGDTLWDISSYYLRDPYAWPRLWSWNEHITNAHWIFPGDRVRLYDPRSGPRGNDRPNLRYSQTRVPEGSTGESFVLNQTAFVDAAQFETAMRIVGGGEANVMMSTLDTVYMSYERSRPPIPGERLVVYAPQEKVQDLKNRKVLGYIVQIMGEVEVQSIARNTAEGTVAVAINPIERGYRVGPLRRQFRRVDEVPAEKSATGVVVATMNDTSPIPIAKERKRKSLLGDHVLVGETQFVVVNIGSERGVAAGNLLEVVRKGDEYTGFRRRNFRIPYEDGWPRRIIGACVVLQTQATTSLCATTYSRREIERGDHVELRGPELLARERKEKAASEQGKAPPDDGKRRRGRGEASYKLKRRGARYELGGDGYSGR